MDDILCIHHDPDDLFNKLNWYVPLKSTFLGATTCILAQFLSACNYIMTCGLGQWVHHYFQEAIIICKEQITKVSRNRFAICNSPKLAVSLSLGPNVVCYYQSLISVIRWMMEVRSIDINTKAALVSLHLAMPKKWDVKAVLHIMGCLKLSHNSRWMFEPSYIDMDYSYVQECNWMDFYQTTMEAIPPKAPSPKGKR